MDEKTSTSLAAPQFAPVLWLTILLTSFACAIMAYPLGITVASATMLIITVGLIKPEYVIYGSIFIILISGLKMNFKFGNFSFSSNLLPIPMFLALIFWHLARLARLIPSLKYTTSFDLLVLITWFSAIISMLWTPHPDVGLLFVIHLTIGVMYYFILTRLIRTRDQITLFYRFWVIFGIFTLLEIIFSFYKGYDATLMSWYGFLGFNEISLTLYISKYDGTRESLSAFVGNPKNIGILLNLAIICVTIFLFLAKKTLYRVLLCIVLIFMLGAHLLASCRAEMGGLFLGWIYIILRNPTWRPRFFRYQLHLAGLSLLSLGLALFVVSHYSPAAMVDFLGRLGVGPGVYHTRGGSSGGARLDLFWMGAEAFFQTGGIGYGIGGLMPDVEPNLKVNVPNIPLAFLFDHGYGMLSLILCSWLYLNIALEVRRALRFCQNQPYFYYMLGFAWILIAFGAASLLDHHFVHDTYWFVLGLCMAGVQAAYLQGVPKNELKQAVGLSSGELKNKGDVTR